MPERDANHLDNSAGLRLQENDRAHGARPREHRHRQRSNRDIVLFRSGIFFLRSFLHGGTLGAKHIHRDQQKHNRPGDLKRRNGNAQEFEKTLSHEHEGYQHARRHRAGQARSAHPFLGAIVRSHGQKRRDGRDRINDHE